MKTKTPIINILTYGLPYALTNQIYNEYQSRISEAKFLIEKSSRFKILAENISTVELLFAISIFHKRVISNLDGAVKFYKTVNKFSQADIIAIGSYDLTFEEKNKILGLLINYRQLIEKYGITESMMDYYLTKTFLFSIIKLKFSFKDADSNNKKES